MALQAEKTVSGPSRQIEVLTALRQCSCNTFCTQDQAGAAIGDAILLIRETLRASLQFAKTVEFPNPEFEMIRDLIEEINKVHSLWYHRIKDRMDGVSEETTTGVKSLYQMQASGTLLFPAINVDDSVTKSKGNDLNGCGLSPPFGPIGEHVMIADKSGVGCGCILSIGEYVMLADKVGVGCGYGDVGKPFCAGIIGEHVMIADKVGVGCGYGDVGKPFCAGIIALAEGRLMNLGCATDHPSFVMSCSFTKPGIAPLELCNEKKSGKYEEKVYVLLKHLDETKGGYFEFAEFGSEADEAFSFQNSGKYEEKVYVLPKHLDETKGGYFEFAEFGSEADESFS